MLYRRILVTGGAGFVGSALSLAIKRDHPECSVVALDNLKRRGSELALPRLRAGGVAFQHGDIRSPEDLHAVGAVDLMIDCSAEPSVHAGYGQSPAYLVNTNLTGLVNCLDYLRHHGGDLLFLSTSRVYPIAGLRGLPLVQQETRLALQHGASGPGWSEEGIAEDFAMVGARSLYGATKLASELLIDEYRAMYGLRAAVLRCGVLTGPWQMGKVDQGFAVLWMARHVFGGALSYSGFGGAGLQVRDMLHVDDLHDLCSLMLRDFGRFNGAVLNAGGGADLSVSLCELTALCQAISNQRITLHHDAETRPADIPYYVSDCRRLRDVCGWRPQRSVETILHDIHAWLIENRSALEPVLAQ